jgi:hypothetical protein
MKLIIDCAAVNIPAAIRLLNEQSEDWERRYDKVGWGWAFQLGEDRCFIRRVKDGLSLKQLAPTPAPSTPTPFAQNIPAEVGEGE